MLGVSSSGFANLHTKKTLRIIGALSNEDCSLGEGSGTPARLLIQDKWYVAPSGWMRLGEVVQDPNAIYPAAVGLVFRS